MRLKYTFKTAKTQYKYNLNIEDMYNEEDYYNMSDLNWKDDTLETGIGDIDGSDPSKKGYNKGYQLDPYEERYYANYNGGNRMHRLKKAVVEVRDISYSAENYVNELLSIWKESDGPIQDFFDAFTSNGKVSNRDKKEMAKLLGEKGYKVTPWLLDETVRYANNQYFNDIQISDESLKQMEDMLSGNQTPLVQKKNNSGKDIGYNQIDDQYSDVGGPAPSLYEVTSKKMSRLKKNSRIK